MAKISVRIVLSEAGLPLSFTLRGRLFTARELLDSWQGADHAYFKLIADDGNLYVIRHDRDADVWELVLMEAASGITAREDERRG
ncbi:MAG TPA: hypothetical protein VL949_11515 [Geobacteraceae bacterium]|jgi:hypothetical protein|nr:hypothetical protein [Geobacteraceae bacterium]